METRIWAPAKGNFCAVLSLFAFVLATGCGGGGGGDDDGGGGQSQNPSSLAPESLVTQVLALNESGGTSRQIRFSATGANWTESTPEGTIEGTYEYRRDNANSATITLNGPNEVQTLALAFSNEENGVFSYVAGPPLSGTFTLHPSPDGDPGDPPDPGDHPGQTGLAPASLAGRTMLGTRTSTSTGPKGQTHTYTFTARTFHDSDPPEESDGNYTYDPSGDQARLVLDYTQPRLFAGDHHEWDMNFTSATAGTFTSTYMRKDGTLIVINGNFRFQ